MKYLVLLTCCLVVFTSGAQPGCTDPQALNYNAAAVTNDGSCAYPLTSHHLTLKAAFPSRLSESSGLVWTNGELWTHNDSGNESAIYRVDTATGLILQRVLIDNYPNNDWEDITADSSFIYVGDFGNNNGNRTNLKVLKIAKDSIGTDSLVHVKAQAISFSYSDQTTFIASNTHNFDCEAITSVKDTLYLFTKDCGDHQTKVYRLPKTPGAYSIAPYTSFDVDGLITGADYHPATNEIILVGYAADYTQSFLWLMNDFAGDSFFSGNKRRITLANYQYWQTEAVTFLSPDRFFVSCESRGGVDASLYVGCKEWTSLPTSVPSGPSIEPLRISPNPTTGSILVWNLESPCDFIVYDSLGRPSLKGKLDKTNNEINLIAMPAGTYFIDLTETGGRREKVKVTRR